LLDEVGFKQLIESRCKHNFSATKIDSSVPKTKTNFTLSQINQMQENTIKIGNSGLLNNLNNNNSSSTASFFKTKVPTNDMVDVDSLDSKGKANIDQKFYSQLWVDK